MAANELDVRRLRKPDKHPHDEFEAYYPGDYDWKYLDEGPTVWRIRITKLTDTPPPVRHGHLELALEPLESSVRQEI